MFMSCKEYDAWKKKHSQETKEREAMKQKNQEGNARKRAYADDVTIKETSSLPKQQNTTGVMQPPLIGSLVSMETNTVIFPHAVHTATPLSEPSSPTTFLPRPLRPTRPPPSPIALAPCLSGQSDQSNAWNPSLVPPHEPTVLYLPPPEISTALHATSSPVLLETLHQGAASHIAPPPLPPLDSLQLALDARQSADLNSPRFVLSFEFLQHSNSYRS